MSSLASRLLDTLLVHHKVNCRPITVAADDIESRTVRDLCLTYAEVTPKGGPKPNYMGQPLSQIGKLCMQNRWPCLDSLVVQEDTGVPGPGYFKLHAGGPKAWQDEVRKCILFKGYPDRVRR